MGATVRALSAAALLEGLNAHAGAAVEYLQTPTPLTGGFSAALYAFELAAAPPPLDGPLVARVVDEAAQARTERAFQHAATEAGFPAPRIHALVPYDVTRAIIVMDRVAGVTPLRAAGRRGLPRLFRELPALLAGLMADLHGCRPPSDERGSDVDALLSVVDDEPRAWLTRNRPRVSTEVLCHGDLHGENVIVESGRVVGVVDWELAGVGPRELDVARTALILELLPGVPAPARRLLRRLSRGSARAFIDAYTARAPVDRSILAWCMTLHRARLLAIARQPGTVGAVWRPLVPMLTDDVRRATAP